MTMKKSLRELYDAHQGKLSDRLGSYLSAYDIILGPFESVTLSVEK